MTSAVPAAFRTIRLQGLFSFGRVHGSCVSERGAGAGRGEQSAHLFLHLSGLRRLDFRRVVHDPAGRGEGFGLLSGGPVVEGQQVEGIYAVGNAEVRLQVGSFGFGMLPERVVVLAHDVPEHGVAADPRSGPQDVVAPAVVAAPVQGRSRSRRETGSRAADCREGVRRPRRGSRSGPRLIQMRTSLHCRRASARAAVRP